MEQPKLCTYRLIKDIWATEKYLFVVPFKRHKIALAKFRCSNFQIGIETGRKDHLSREDRLCAYCESNNISVIEDEYHVLLKCPQYQKLRERFTDKLVSVHPSVYVFTNVMKSQNLCTINEIAVFLYNVHQMRL